jgi:hypothetical protein
MELVWRADSRDAVVNLPAGKGACFLPAGRLGCWWLVHTLAYLWAFSLPMGTIWTRFLPQSGEAIVWWLSMSGDGRAQALWLQARPFVKDCPHMDLIMSWTGASDQILPLPSSSPIFLKSFSWCTVLHMNLSYAASSPGSLMLPLMISRVHIAHTQGEWTLQFLEAEEIFRVGLCGALVPRTGGIDPCFGDLPLICISCAVWVSASLPVCSHLPKSAHTSRSNGV